VFYFLRIYRNIGHLIRMIFVVLYEMRFFFFIFFCIVLAFANTFYMLSENNEPEDKFIHSYLDALQFSFFMTFQRFDTRRFGKTDTFLVWTFFFMEVLVFIYLMVRLTISMVKEFYDQVEKRKESYQYRVMT